MWCCACRYMYMSFVSYTCPRVYIVCLDGCKRGCVSKVMLHIMAKKIRNFGCLHMYFCQIFQTAPSVTIVTRILALVALSNGRHPPFISIIITRMNLQTTFANVHGPHSMLISSQTFFLDRQLLHHPTLWLSPSSSTSK